MGRIVGDWPEFAPFVAARRRPHHLQHQPRTASAYLAARRHHSDWYGNLLLARLGFLGYRLNGAVFPLSPSSAAGPLDSARCLTETMGGRGAANIFALFHACPSGAAVTSSPRSSE